MKCLSEDILELYLDGEMLRTAADVVYQHLSICESCRNRRDKLVSFQERITRIFKSESLIHEAERVVASPITDMPTSEQITEWLESDMCPATDGCIVEHDGICSHGYVSWLKYLGLV
ncbi:MAG: hypothetical protein US74_C0016G0005 [Parcubacteria group bacterium GW2011_GWA2_38_13]|nr:MAG: hypothetical protein US74_C0016G0005 [Parcubacteria group bacterium GW2011_GWA2_38_13]